METAKEVTKTNGKAKVKKAQKPVEPSPSKPKPEKISGWSIARDMLAAGSKDEAIKKAVQKHLAETTTPEAAMKYFVERWSYRMLFRAHRAAKKAGKEKAHATK